MDGMVSVFDALVESGVVARFDAKAAAARRPAAAWQVRPVTAGANESAAMWERSCAAGHRFLVSAVKKKMRLAKQQPKVRVD